LLRPLIVQFPDGGVSGLSVPEGAGGEGVSPIGGTEVSRFFSFFCDCGAGELGVRLPAPGSLFTATGFSPGRYNGPFKPQPLPSRQRTTTLARNKARVVVGCCELGMAQV